jgi:hypothetical protein
MRQTCLRTSALHAKKTGNGECVFPGDRNSKRPMSNNTILKGLERMGYKGAMTGHGLRGVASTILHEQGYPHEHIELQLAHAPRNPVSAAYNHALHLKARTTMMQDWATSTVCVRAKRYSHSARQSPNDDLEGMAVGLRRDLDLPFTCRYRTSQPTLLTAPIPLEQGRRIEAQSRGTRDHRLRRPINHRTSGPRNSWTHRRACAN